MICKKIPHLLSTSLFVVLPALFFTLFSFSSSVFATSVTCSYTSGWTTSSDSDVNISDISDCDLTGLDSSASNYFITVSPSYTYTNGYSNVITRLFFNLYTSAHAVTSSSVGAMSYYSTTIGATAQTYNLVSSYIPQSLSFQMNLSVNHKNSVTFTITDESPYSEDCDCPEVPDIPENPYDPKLDEIKQAILIVPATLLVIYFLFCLYQILIKNGGRK